MTLGYRISRIAGRLAGAVLLVASFTLFVGLLADSLRPVGAESNEPLTATKASSNSLSLTLAGSCQTFDPAVDELVVDVVSGGIASSCLSLHVATDASYGYTLSFHGPADGTLWSDDGEVIIPTGGTLGSPAVFSHLPTVGAWGFAIPNSQTQGFDFGFDDSYQVLERYNTDNSAKFASVPVAPTPISTTDKATVALSGYDAYDFFFAVSAGHFMSPGSYIGAMTFTVAVNEAPPVPLFMQDITHLNCPTERTLAVDARDNRSYWVQKLNDGRCWMLTNLAYAGGGDNAFGDTVTLYEGKQSDRHTPLFAVPPDANPTTFPEHPSTTTDGGVSVSTRQFGFFYNWCAALGDQQGTSACVDATAPPHDKSISVCPAGWRLPTGGFGGEFATLVNAISDGSNMDPAGLLRDWLFQYSGSVGSEGFPNAGALGTYWASTAIGNNSHILQVSNNVVLSTALSNPANSRSVRCVIEEVEPLVMMQEVTLETCPLERTMAVDARDNRTYWIRRVPGTRAGGEDLCWMETNLAYAGGGDNQFGDTMTLEEGTDNNPYIPLFARPPGANPTTLPIAPSLSTEGQSQFGYLYNWCAVMGGQPSACQTGTFFQPEQIANNGTEVFSVCPRGWRLPAGEPITGELTILNDMINSGVTSSPPGLLINGLFQYSGWFLGGGFELQGALGVGGLWSSTSATASSSHILWFHTTSVNPANISIKGIGLAVRCVAE